MEPGKKITIRKKEGGAGPVVVQHDDSKRQDALVSLENTVKKLKNRFQQFGFNDSREEEFLNDNRGKDVVLELAEREVAGQLQAIDKYRIALSVDGKTQFFYKHAVVGYYAKP